MSFTDVNAHTKQIIANKQYKNMGKISVTTPDRSNIALEKSFALEGSGSVLSLEKKAKTENKVSLPEETEVLKKNTSFKFSRNVSCPENISIDKKEITNSENTEIVNVPVINNEAMQMINALMHTQNHIVQELTDVFDKRLEKFDEIILDLIRCKTENERLKQKVDNLTRDNYKYKKDVESFRSVIPGLYIKKELDKTKF